MVFLGLVFVVGIIFGELKGSLQGILPSALHLLPCSCGGRGVEDLVATCLGPSHKRQESLDKKCASSWEITKVLLRMLKEQGCIDMHCLLNHRPHRLLLNKGSQMHSKLPKTGLAACC